MFSSFHNSRVEVEVCSLSGLVYCLEVTSTTIHRRKLSWLLYEWESQAFFPVGRGIWFEPRAVLPLHSCDLLSVGDDATLLYTRGKSLLESWVTTFLPDWQPPLIFVWFFSNFLCMCSCIVDSAHVILKYIRQRLRVAVSREDKWYPTILRVICL